MKRIILSILICAALLAAAPGADQSAASSFDLQHIRNATVKLTSDGTTFLVDPMFAEVGAYEGFTDTHRSWLRNLLRPLPMPVNDILVGVDAVILTHTHLDHWDKAAQDQLPKDIPLYVQNQEDADLVRGQGFTDVRIMGDSDEFAGGEAGQDTDKARFGSHVRSS